jgi:rare lipoprotein A
MRGLTLLSIAAVVLSLVLSGCSSGNKRHSKLDPFAGQGSPIYPGSGPVPMGGGRYHVGKPYQVAGRWFEPKEQPNYDKKGVASWYGEAFNRRRTSNGEWFDMTRLTAAHATLPLPSYVKVTNLENGREVIVRVNDRGPFVGTRIIDLSKRTAEVLAFKSKGKADVRVQYIGRAPLNDDGSHLMAMNDELGRGTSLKRMIAAADRSTRPGTQIQVAERTTTIAKQDTEISMEPPADDGVAAPGPYFVQVASFTNIDNAERAGGALASAWPVQLVQVSGAGGPIYRVRLGPIDNRTDADTALGEAMTLGYHDAHVVLAQPMQAALQ